MVMWNKKLESDDSILTPEDRDYAKKLIKSTEKLFDLVNQKYKENMEKVKRQDVSDKELCFTAACCEIAIKNAKEAGLEMFMLQTGMPKIICLAIIEKIIESQDQPKE